MCTDTSGSYTCATIMDSLESIIPIPIITGIKVFSIYIVHADINECYSMDPCNDNATCTDTLGSFICTCNNGFTGDGLTCQSNVIRVLLIRILKN